jgi:NADH-ubiquinone oxidoreductase chain 3
MTSTTFFFFFIPCLAFILLAVNLIFAPHNPYQEKDSPFECGYHSFLGQNRTQFNISFFVFALLFLLFDLEILLVYPYVVSAYLNSILGLIIVEIFFFVLTAGLVYELGKGVLKVPSRQNNGIESSDSGYNNSSNYNYNFTAINDNKKFKFSASSKINLRLIHTGNTPPRDQDWDSDQEDN